MIFIVKWQMFVSKQLKYWARVRILPNLGRFMGLVGRNNTERASSVKIKDHHLRSHQMRDFLPEGWQEMMGYCCLLERLPRVDQRASWWRNDPHRVLWPLNHMTWHWPPRKRVINTTFLKMKARGKKIPQNFNLRSNILVWGHMTWFNL